jgi:hypothetical protein
MGLNMYSDDDFFRILGHISVFFATLDLFASEVILRLTGWTSGTALPFGETATLGHKLTLLGEMRPEHVANSAVLLDLQRELPRAQTAARERNRYIHDQWIFDPTLIPQGRIRRARWPLGQAAVQELTLQELHSFLQEIGQLQRVFAGALRILHPRGFTEPEA